jgi:hypothetical protein
LLFNLRGHNRRDRPVFPSFGWQLVWAHFEDTGLRKFDANPVF